MFPYFVAAGVTTLFLLLGVLIWMSVRNRFEKNDYEDQLGKLLEDDDVEKKVKVGPIQKWNRHWGKILKGAGFEKYKNEETSSAGRDVFALVIAIAIVVAVLTQNIFAGLGVSILLVAVSGMLIKNVSNKNSEAISKQLPGFLFALKANIQASETNERAMLKVIDNMPSPLYEDLIVVKNKLLASGSFRESLEDLQAKTASSELKFLAACMIQAAASGANLENLIDSIQNILEQRRKVADEIDRAVKSSQPAIWLASGVLPALFLASYSLDVSSRDFWFVTALSWAALVGVAVLYVAGLLLVRREVAKIRNL